MTKFFCLHFGGGSVAEAANPECLVGPIEDDEVVATEHALYKGIEDSVDQFIARELWFTILDTGEAKTPEEAIKYIKENYG